MTSSLVPFYWGRGQFFSSWEFSFPTFSLAKHEKHRKSLLTTKKIKKMPSTTCRASVNPEGLSVKESHVINTECNR
jgi:hypothetical protein